MPLSHHPGSPSVAQPVVEPAASLAQFGFAWFIPVMGWCGLALAWLKAPQEGALWAPGMAGFASAMAALVFVLVGLASLYRWLRHPQAVRAEVRHPVRQSFTATVPISLILLSTLGMAWSGGQDTRLQVLWWLGALGEFAITVWVLSRCLRPPDAGGLAWPVVTPVLIIPVVGNVLVTLANLQGAGETWVAAQFGLGIFLWPLVLGLMLARWIHVGPLPAHMTPTLFIMVAPPSVIGLAFLQWQTPVQLAWAAWGVAWMSMLWALSQLASIRQLPFGMAHWGMSFPLAAFAVPCLRLGLTPHGGWLVWPAQMALWFATFVILWLSAKTLQGLLNGHLLKPES